MGEVEYGSEGVRHDQGLDSGFVGGSDFFLDEAVKVRYDQRAHYLASVSRESSDHASEVQEREVGWKRRRGQTLAGTQVRVEAIAIRAGT